MAEEWVRLGELADFPDGLRKFRIDFRTGWLLRRGDSIVAYLNLCTHAGGELRPQDGGFRCLRHGGTFDADGVPLSGPPVGGLPLRTVDVKVEHGVIYFKRVTQDE